MALRNPITCAALAFLCLVLAGCLDPSDPNANPENAQKRLEDLKKLVNESEGAAKEAEAPPKPKAKYPVKRQLTSADNRTIQVVITGRTGTEVVFYREDDPLRRRQAYPINALTPDDQVFLATLAVGGKTDVETVEEARARHFDEEELAVLETKLKELNLKLDSKTLTIHQRQALSKDREILRLRVREMEARLKAAR